MRDIYLIYNYSQKANKTLSSIRSKMMNSTELQSPFVYINILVSSGTLYALRHDARKEITHKIPAFMYYSSFYQALQDQERICAQWKGMGCQHQNKTTGDKGECYLNLLLPVPRRSMFFIGYLPQKTTWRKEAWKEWSRSRKHSFEKGLKTQIFLQRTFRGRDMMNACQIMNGLQKLNVCSSDLMPQLERQHNDNKRIRDFEKQ